MENHDDSGEVADATRLARDVTQHEDIRCSAIRALAGTIACEADEAEVSASIRVCAAVVKDQPAAVRDAAMQALEQTIRGRAKAAVKGFRSTTAKDFIEMSAGLIYELIATGKYDPESSGSFRGWCYTVLRRKWISEIRKPNAHTIGCMGTGNSGERTSENENDLIEDGRPIHEHLLDLRTLREGAFESEDMETLRAWKTENRVMLLTLSGLWTKVCNEHWRQWLDELQIASPFPPDDFGSFSRDQERFQLVAEAFHRINPVANAENVKRKWYRLLPSLANLRCIERLK